MHGLFLMISLMIMIRFAGGAVLLMIIRVGCGIELVLGFDVLIVRSVVVWPRRRPLRVPGKGG